MSSSGHVHFSGKSFLICAALFPTLPTHSTDITMQHSPCQTVAAKIAKTITKLKLTWDCTHNTVSKASRQTKLRGTALLARGQKHGKITNEADKTTSAHTVNMGNK